LLSLLQALGQVLMNGVQRKYGELLGRHQRKTNKRSLLLFSREASIAK